MRHSDRNTRPMQASPRCQALTRSGAACRAPAIKGEEYCRMHSPYGKPGAPYGNHNAKTHGAYLKAERKRRKALEKWRRDALAYLELVEKKAAEAQLAMMLNQAQHAQRTDRY